MGIFDRSVDNHVSNPRKKLGTNGNQVERVRNVRGAGYVYIAEPGMDGGSDS